MEEAAYESVTEQAAGAAVAQTGGGAGDDDARNAEINQVKSDCEAVLREYEVELRKVLAAQQEKVRPSAPGEPSQHLLPS